MLHTMKIQLLTDNQHHENLTEVMSRFNRLCNRISEIGFRTNTHSSTSRLSKECYHLVRQEYAAPAQMVVRAIGKVIDAYKTGFKGEMKFGEHTSVVYDTRSLTFRWMNHISISTFDGRMEVRYRVSGYRQGTYDRRVQGLADLIIEDNTFFLLLLVDLPVPSDMNMVELTEAGTTSSMVVC